MRSLVIFASRPLCFALLQSSFLLLLLLYKITRKKEEDERERERQQKREAILGDVDSEKNIGDRYPTKEEIRFFLEQFPGHNE